MSMIKLILVTAWSAITAWTFAYLAVVLSGVMGVWFTVDCWFLVVLSLATPFMVKR